MIKVLNIEIEELRGTESFLSISRERISQSAEAQPPADWKCPGLFLDARRYRLVVAASRFDRSCRDRQC